MPGNGKVGVPKELRTYDDDFLHCRTLGHAWEIVGFYRDEGGLVRRALECTTCETTRTDRWDASSGERFAPDYRYVSGYKATGDPFQSFDLRREVVRRADVYASEDQMVAALTGGRKR